MVPPPLFVRAVLRPLAVLAACSASGIAFGQPTVPSPVPDAPRPPFDPVFVSDVAPMERIGFDEAVRRALARNPTARQADDEVRRFHALMEEARAASLPTLTGYATYTRLDHDRFANGVLVSANGQLNANVTLNAPLLYPRGWVAWAQAGDQVDVARANLADVRRSVAVSTARAYLSIIAERRLLETARTARDNAKSHYEFTRARRVGGIGNRLDEMRAAQQLTTEEVNVQRQAIALVRAREGLGIFVADDRAVDALDDVPAAQMPAYGEALTEAEKLRPDVRARRRAETATQRTVDSAWADYVPYLDLALAPFYEDPATATLPRTGWQAQLVLTVPIYDGGLRYGQEHERMALANEAQVSSQATLRQARSDVRLAFEGMQRADAALDQATQSAAFAKHALELANMAYRAGATTNLEVIDAERQARDADTQAAIAEDSSRQARLDLLAASGRFP